MFETLEERQKLWRIGWKMALLCYDCSRMSKFFCCPLSFSSLMLSVIASTHENMCMISGRIGINSSVRMAASQLWCCRCPCCSVKTENHFWYQITKFVYPCCPMKGVTWTYPDGDYLLQNYLQCVGRGVKLDSPTYYQASKAPVLHLLFCSVFVCMRKIPPSVIEVRS